MSMSRVGEEDGERLAYSIHSCSSYSGEFTPDRVQADDPADPKSRWLSDGSKVPQHITVKLAAPAVVLSVVFGKYEKSHACNLRRFSVFGGMECDHMYLLCEGGLTDNSKPESFPLRHEVGGRPFPCQFVKVVPVQSWGGTLYSVWYLELRGITAKPVVSQAQKWLQQFCRKQALRLCMKHLRECDYSDAYLTLCKQSRVELEHPLLSQLHSTLVVRGDFVTTEAIVQQAAEDGYLDQYVSQQPVQAKWSPVKPTSEEKPGMRGGHQMCMDAEMGLLYMFGGWDGINDLSDLWQFTVETLRWDCLSTDTSQEGGPSGRSCHKMCLDSGSQQLFLLGRYLSPSSRSPLSPTNIPGDFFRYSIADRMWQLLSADTHAQGGPHLIYDHQMTFDPITFTLYVFGGRVLTSCSAVDSADHVYSGLYSYNTLEGQWSCLRPDYSGGSPYPHNLVPRMAHSLLLHPIARKLYVIGGQRNKQPLSDMLTFDLQSKETEILANGKDTSVPAAGFTIRTTLDPVHNEIHLLTGLNKFEGTRDHGVKKGVCSNSLWLYRISSKTWTCVLSGDQRDWCPAAAALPAPRYAHQLVFDPSTQSHYMFGGNLGNEVPPSPQASMRLDDFWKLKLVHQTRSQLVRKCKVAIRRQKFHELAQSDQVQALAHLQSSLSTLVNHNDEDESAEV
ncbi:Muskelin [Geodia barretti]|uniref:Muskelin n=1 Tax=Geodia barretti TaxID=519541 RepID=A0AA35X7R6_GEOBA|nr:Muskelin [Geodia barretti]